MNPKIGRNVGRFGMTIKKNLPTITTVGSAAAAIGATVLSARAAYKSVPTIERHKKAIEQLHANKDKFETVKEYNKETMLVYKDTAIDLAKDYWPAGVALGLTLAGIFTTNSVHKKRYLTMAGMYTALSAAYEEYRKRVSNKYGVEEERDLYLGIQREEIVTVETDKKGKEKTKVTKVVKAGSVTDPTFSTWLIDDNCKLWYHGRPEMTYYVLVETQNDLTQMLRTRGYVFLNEVFRALQLPEVPEGQIIGWVYDETKSESDNCIDFGLREGSENYELFMNGKNDYVYINLNHDGTIYDKFPSFDRIRIRNDARRI